MSRRACSASNCKNNRHVNSDLAFFTLPADHDRCMQWLQLIDREDLENKSKKNFQVCEIHFDSSDILLTQNRKMLKKSALPSVNLPSHVNPAACSVNANTVARKERLKNSRRSCVAASCRNNRHVNSDLAFFTLPNDHERCMQWLQLIGREDLENRSKKNFQVCEAHFNPSDILLTQKRKVLKKCALPALNLTNEQQDSHASTSSATQGPPSVSEILDGKVLIFRVYSYLFNEYEEIKAYTRNICDLSPLSNILRRTAGATGVSEHVVATILDEKRKGNDEVPEKRARLSIEVESASSQTEAAISYDIPIDVVPATICGVPAPIVEIVPSVKVEIEPEEIQYPQYVPCEGHVTISVEPLPQVSEQPSCSSADTGIWTGTPVQVKSEPPDEDEYTTSSFSSEHTHDFTDPSRDPQLRSNTETQHTQYQYAEFGDSETGIATRVTVKAEPADM